MNTKILVVVIFPQVMNIMESDIAGRPAADYLLESLNDWNNDKVKVVAISDGSDHSLFEKFPKISKFSPSEPHPESCLDEGLLIIDARAWLPRAALADVLTIIHGATNSIRIVENSADIFVGHREAMTLAFYLPRDNVCQDLFVRERTGDGQGLEHVLNSRAIADSCVVAWSNQHAICAAMMSASFADLAEIERRLLFERALAVMKLGVRIRDPNSAYIRGELVCGSGVTIEPNVIIEGRVVVGDGVQIGANSILRSCQIGANTKINPFSLVEQASIGADSFVGPYGRIRPGSVIGNNVQIGNYVEIKNSQIGDGSRVNHHTFIGDAMLSDQVTIGAGTITCNHDGFGTNQTVIERGAYIGSGCNLVAPLHIGQDAVIGAGSTIAQDVPATALTLARGRQVTMQSWAGPKSRRQKE